MTFVSHLGQKKYLLQCHNGHSGLKLNSMQHLTMSPHILAQLHPTLQTWPMKILGAFQGVWNDCLPVPPIQQWWEQTSHLITEPQSGWILGSVAHCCLLVGWFSFYPPATHRWELHPLYQPLSRPPNSLLIVFNKDFQDYTGSNTHLNLCACYLNYMYSLLLLLLLLLWNAAECLPCYTKRKCPPVHCAVCI